ncbi:MAG: Txe/YoeB family addiction module toxin [Prochloraceae cyanobacterium]|nr:Txe/YoeB family addiction module toxin [Prochloraceae cyanobacterium]
MSSKKKPKKQEPDSSPQPLPVNRYPIFDQQFREDLGWWYKQDQKIAYKILDLVSATMQEPFSGIVKSEPLKHLASDIWSRRINLEHRLVYRVRNDRIDFLQARYHY